MVMFEDEKHKYPIDGYLKDNLNTMNEVVHDDDDFVLLLDGRERAGKSVFAQQIAYYLDRDFKLNNIVFTVDDFLDKVRNSEPYSCIVWDEAFRGLNKRQAISRVNKKVVQTLMEVGQKNLFIIIVLPTFFELDKYAVLHRAKGLIHIHRDTLRSDKRLLRGFFKFYSYKKMKEMYFHGRFEYKYCRQCDYFGRFPHYYTVDQEEYRNKKTKVFEANDEDQEEGTMLRSTFDRNIVLNILKNEMRMPVKKLHRYILSKNDKFTLSYRIMADICKEKRSYA